MRRNEEVLKTIEEVVGSTLQERKEKDWYDSEAAGKVKNLAKIDSMNTKME